MQHKGKVFIHWAASSHMSKDGGRYSYDMYDWTHRNGEYGPIGLDGYTLLGTVEIECEIDDFDPRQKLIEKLQAEKAGIITEATRKAENLEEKIQQLLALPSGDAVPVAVDEEEHLF